MRTMWAVARLDVLRRQRWWMLRLPRALPTIGRVRAAVGLSGLAAAAAVALAGSTVLVLVPPDDRERVVGAVTALLLLLTVFRLISGTSPYRVLQAFEKDDSAFLASIGASSRTVVGGRLVIPQLVTDGASTLVLGLGATVAFAVSGTPLGDGTGLWLLLLAQPLVGVTSQALAMLSLRLCLRAPRGRAVVAAALVEMTGPVVAAVGVALVASRVIGAAADAASPGQLVTEVVAGSALDTLSRGEGPGSLVVVLGAGLLLALVPLALAVVALSPRSLTDVQDRLREGRRWRRDAPLPRRDAVASLDKDARLLLRRGLPASQFLRGLLDMLPFVVGLAATGMVVVAGDAVGLGASGFPFVEEVVVLSNACLVVALMGLASDSITPLLSVDTDGPVLRILRGHERGFARYLTARAVAGAAVLAGFTTLATVAVHVVAPWPGVSGVAVALMGAVAAACEAVVVVVGTAYKPALYRPAVGQPETEPAVRTVSAFVLVGVIAVTGPLVLLATRVPAPPVVAVVALVAAGCLGLPLAKLLTPVVHRRVGQGALHAA